MKDQIKELAEHIKATGLPLTDSESETLADVLYMLNYRKQSEVIDEFAERLKPRVDCEYGNKFYRDKCFEEIDNLVEEMKGGE